MKKKNYKSSVVLTHEETGEIQKFNSLEDACEFLGISSSHLMNCYGFNKLANGYHVEIIFGRKRPTIKRLEDNVENLPDEVWLPITNEYFSSAYAISNMGRLKSFYGRKNILLSPFDMRGLLYVRLSYKGLTKCFLLANLVLSAFNPTNIENNRITYKDGDKHNICLSNLTWVKQQCISMDGEIWGAIPNYNNYYASNFGRIRCGLRSIEQHIVKGYAHISMKNDEGEYKNVRVSRAVASAFLSKEKYDKSIWNELVVNHIDGNKLNNHVENLEWCTTKENVLHAYRTKLNPTVHPIYIEYEGFIYTFFTTTEISDVLTEFREITSSQLRIYVNSGKWYKNKYLLFDDKYVPTCSKIPSLEGEVWKEIYNCPDRYFISNKGRLRHMCLNQSENLVSPIQAKRITGKNMYQLMAEYFSDVDLKFVYVKDNTSTNFSLDNLMFNEIENLPEERWKLINTIWIEDKISKTDLDRLLKYEISTYGRIRCIRNIRMYVTQGHHKRNKVFFRFCCGSKQIEITIGRIMCLTFLPIESCKTNKDYAKYTAVHIDRNPKNNKLDNLKWEKQ